VAQGASLAVEDAAVLSSLVLPVAGPAGYRATFGPLRAGAL
jgi:hypothetical protein